MTKRPRLFLHLVLACALLGLGCSSKAPHPDAAGRSAETTIVPQIGECGPLRPHQPGDFMETIMAGGVPREYLLHIPSSYRGDQTAPLVLMLHGTNTRVAFAAEESGLPKRSEQSGFVLVTPQARGTPIQWTFAPNSSDVEFLQELLAKLEGSLCVDKTRIYAVGFSAGGIMSGTLTCSFPGRFAAIAMLSLFDPRRCSARPPTPLIGFFGTADPIQPFEGGDVAFGQVNPPVLERARRWADQNGCAPEPVEERVAEHVRRSRHQGCSQEASVDIYVIEGGGHAWPGSAVTRPPAMFGAKNIEIDATDLIWEFLRAHSREQ